MATVAKQLNEHSKKISILQEQQIEYYKILSSIDKKLSDDFFAKVEVMYEYMIIGNGEPPLKQWRREIDQERKDNKVKSQDAKTERRKWVYGIAIFGMGAIVSTILHYL